MHYHFHCCNGNEGLLTRLVPGPMGLTLKFWIKYAYELVITHGSDNSVPHGSDCMNYSVSAPWV